ncbi:MAG: hypothetical protein RLZZ362_2542 [Actinomycetota bacterium]|jgi:hypothetical protein
MLTSNVKKRFAVGLVAAGVAAGAMVGTSANADPAQFKALVGVGSDTTQDVLNGFSGRIGNSFFTPVISSTGTGATQVVSFDATGSACIIPKPGFGAYDRPNGSTNGARALSRAIDGIGWGKTTATGGACGRQDVSGAFDFARSSSLGVNTTTGTGSSTTFDLTYIPFGRDAMSFGVYRAAGSPVTTLTRAQLKDLFTQPANGSITVGGVKIIACGIQEGSGTFQSWNERHGGGTSGEVIATTQCRDLVSGTTGAGITGRQPNGRLQESQPVQLKQIGDIVAAQPGEANTQVLIGFSAGSFIAKSNGVSFPAVAGTNVQIGSISDNNELGGGANLGSPVQVAGSGLAPNPTFFEDSWVGRDVYNVLPSAIVDDPAPNAAKDLFVGGTSSICQATATLNVFGFGSIANCGSTTDRYTLRTGQG